MGSINGTWVVCVYVSLSYLLLRVPRVVCAPHPPVLCSPSQHIRQTVLTRANSKNQVENVAEETEAAVAQAIATDKTPEVRPVSV